jgi:hypothetical protein
MGKPSFGLPTVRVLAGGIQLAAAVSSAVSRCETQVARLLAAWRDGYGGGPAGSYSPQALAARLNVGDWSSVGLLGGKNSPRPAHRPASAP